MKPIRVVHVVEALGIGGLERVVSSLARGASDRFAVAVLALSGGGPIADELRLSGTPVRCLGLCDYYPSSVLRAARAIVGARAEIVHTHGHFAGVAGRLAARLVGVKGIVHHLHTADDTLRPRHRRLERILGAITRHVVCCSEAVSRHAREDLALPRRLLEVVYNGVEPAAVADRAAARRLLGEPPEPVAACVASLTPHKGQSVLLRAWAALPKSARAGTLLLVGDGPDRPRLEALAAELGLAPGVRFAGARTDVRQILPALDVLVAPSLGREGLGLAVLEGMDAGLPVVASRVGGLPEVVEDGRTGVLVQEGDPGALAAALASLLERPDRGRALGDAGRRRIEERFRADAMVRRIEGIYEVTLDTLARAA